MNQKEDVTVPLAALIKIINPSQLTFSLLLVTLAFSTIAAAQSQGNAQMDISRLSCAQLDYMAKKYQSIVESAHDSEMRGTTPGGTVGNQIVAMQAFRQYDRYMQEMSKRCY